VLHPPSFHYEVRLHGQKPRKAIFATWKIGTPNVDEQQQLDKNPTAQKNPHLNLLHHETLVDRVKRKQSYRQKNDLNDLNG
jgi:hypothetical protein